MTPASLSRGCGRRVLGVQLRIVDQKAIERFYRHVEYDNVTGCLLWTGIGGKPYNGYGKFTVWPTQYRAHRWILGQAIGRPLHTDETANHRCGNRLCVNVDHLYVGTQKQNIADALRDGTHYAPGRMKTHCKEGHPLPDPDVRGIRRCRPCDTARARRYRAAKTGDDMADVEFRLAEDGRHVEWRHKCLPERQWPDGWWPFHQLPNAAENGWTIISTDPLTVTPSIQCMTCGTHGFITEGKWVSV